ncbi:MAG: GNAT family N-acetyltransferase [Acidobacteriota bacterium]
MRALRRSDLADVARIDAFHTGERKEAHWKRVCRELLDTRAKRRIGLAYEAPDRRLLGYLLGEVRAFEFGSEPCGWVLAIGIDPKALHLGVGSALLAEACAQFRRAGAPRVRTMVRRNDVPLLAFFRSNGFTGGPYVQLELNVNSDRSSEEVR